MYEKFDNFCLIDNNDEDQRLPFHWAPKEFVYLDELVELDINVIMIYDNVLML